MAVPWLRRLFAGLPLRRPGFDSGSVNVEFLVVKVALGEVFLEYFGSFAVNFTPPMLHYFGKMKKLIIFITGLHNKP
jgi:hypothetical protein